MVNEWAKVKTFISKQKVLQNKFKSKMNAGGLNLSQIPSLFLLTDF